MEPQPKPAPEARVVYDVTFEAMFQRALKGRITPRLDQRLKEAGLDLGQKLKPRYPREVWQRCLTLVMEELYVGVPPDKAWFELGGRMIESFRETVMGLAILGVLRLLGPKRTLARLTQNFNYADNYNQTTLTEVSPTELRLWVNEVSVSPHFTAGIVSTVLQSIGTVNHKVEIAEFDGHQCTYRITLR
jgi:uncharacterized protein (TIGR02265 family)